MVDRGGLEYLYFFFQKIFLTVVPPETIREPGREYHQHSDEVETICSRKRSFFLPSSWFSLEVD